MKNKSCKYYLGKKRAKSNVSSVPRSDVHFEQPFLACPIGRASKIAHHKKSGARKKFVHPCRTLHFGLAPPLIMLNINKIESVAISALSFNIILIIFAIHITSMYFLSTRLMGVLHSLSKACCIYSVGSISLKGSRYVSDSRSTSS